jgi:hypothetical protein
MKSINKIWGIGLLVLLLITFTPGKSKAQEISSQDFYDSLAPYGTWVYDTTYGNVWVPDTDDDFRPYATQGHWVLTEYGNTWVSDYPWGWATFHYGRWHYDDYYGWEWIPGYEWAPAWVSWRQGGGYYGWAPLMPGISVDFSFGGGYNIPDRYWVCAPQAYINRPNIYNYYAPNTRVLNIIHNTTVINNTYVRNNHTYIAGPRAADIQRVTHQRPEVYRIDNANAPGRGGVRNNAVTMFRPAVRKAPDAHPERVVDGTAYRQQNPTQSIARRGPGGGAAFNHGNAAKLATVARNASPENKVMRVVDRPNNRQGQQTNQPQRNYPQTNPVAQPGIEHGQHNAAQPAGQQPANMPQGTRTGVQQQPQPTPVDGHTIDGQRVHGGRPENRPNVTPANPTNQQQPAQQQAQQQQRMQQQQGQQQGQQQQRMQQQQGQQQGQQQQRMQQQQAQQQAQQQQRMQQQQAQQQAQQQQRMQQQQAQQQAQQQQRMQQQQAQQQAQQQQRMQQQQAQQQAQQQQRQQQQARQQQRQQRQAPPPPPPKKEEVKP